MAKRNITMKMYCVSISDGTSVGTEYASKPELALRQVLAKKGVVRPKITCKRTNFEYDNMKTFLARVDLLGGVRESSSFYKIEL